MRVIARNHSPPMAPDFDDLATRAEVDDDEDDEPLEPLADDLSKSMTEDDWRQLENQVEDVEDRSDACNA